MLVIESRHGSRVGTIMDHWRKILAVNIDRLCRRPGFSKSGLAAHCGVAKPQVSRWVDTSEDGAFPHQHLVEISRYLKVRYRDLFDDEPGSGPLVPEPPTPEEALKAIAESMGYQVKKARKKN